MNYYNKYLKYKKKYLLLTGGNFGNPATPGDFTQRFYDDNIIIQNNTLKINDYQDFEQLFSLHFHPNFTQKIKHINILTPHILQDTILALQFIPITTLRIPYKINNYSPPVPPAPPAPLVPLPAAITALLPLPLLPALLATQYYINIPNLEELIIYDGNLPLVVAGATDSTIYLTGQYSDLFKKLKKLTFEGDNNLMVIDYINPVNNKYIELLPILEEIIFDNDFNSDINLKDLLELKSILIKKPNFDKQIRLENLPKLEKIDVNNYTGNIEFNKMGNFINIFLS